MNDKKEIVIVGKKVVKLRQMTKEEMSREGWDRPTMVIQLEGGIKLYASRDSEGNGPGALFGSDKNGQFLL